MQRTVRWLSLACILCAPVTYYSANAQSLELGLYAGLNVPSPTSTAAVVEASRNDMVVGATASLPIAPPLRLQVGAQYINKQFRISTNGGGQPGSSPADLQNMSYLELPISLKVGFGGPVLQGYVLAGTNVGTMLTAAREMDGELASATEEHTSGMQFTAALEAGGGVAYSLSPGVALTTDVRYSFGLIEQADESLSMLDRAAWKPRDLRITAGMLFRLP